MMLRHSLSLETEADAIEQAVDRVISAGNRTTDLGGSLKTTEMTDKVLAELA